MSKRPTPKRTKPAGGYIGQAMRLAKKEPKLGVLGRMAEAQVRVIVREELATRAGSVPREPTEEEVKRAVKNFFENTETAHESMRAVLAWWSNRLSHLRSKP